ncbi:TIGR04149 family rSAM-modified RiPP [Porphyromonas levii]|uniref:TIGR04149 family rSAM-modified RiPP n=1 Tax=Porphyromonas levii TaxID=28114 RepID=UPI001B8B2E28|nr:hypothetical protein [Porphyromonas levii]MBR8729882.1 hypothetical protein [Porphyromonas levii]MBR8759834.1 hypothetical protein [Porphyromonas levii]MBR8801977.1 hypothetical protein [Porphyromonas levii]
MSKINLASLHANRLEERELSRTNGGHDSWTCSCSCYYENNGGSSTHDNAHANAHYRGGKDSKKGDTKIEVIVSCPDCDPR